MHKIGQSIIDLANKARSREVALRGNANPLDILENLVDRIQGTVRYGDNGLAVVHFCEIVGDEYMSPSLRDVTHFATLRLLNSGDWELLNSGIWQG
jgi:hypothetical protein